MSTEPRTRAGRPRAPEAFVPYTPNFRYALCDLAGLSDEAIRGQVLLRAVLLLMKHVADPQLAHRSPTCGRC